MYRFVVMALCAVTLFACGRKSSPVPEAKTNAPETNTEAAKEAPADNAGGAEEAPASPETAPPPGPDVIQVSDTTGDTVVEEPAEPQKSPEGVLGALEKALDGIKRCERVVDSHRLKSPASCLAPVYEARVEVRNPSTSAAPDANARQALRDRLAEIALARIQTDDATELLYLLQSLGADFNDSDETRARLETLMKHEIPAIASAAASARFSRPSLKDSATLKLARSLVESEYADGVRAAACRYIGADIFKGKRAHVKLLLGRALAQVEASVVRGTAVARLGFIGSDAELPSLSRLFRVPATQYAAVFTIQQGLRSKKGFEAIVTWLEEQPKVDKSVQWGTLSALPPRPEDAANFPTERAIKALVAIAASEVQHGRTRSAAVETIAKLGGVSTLSSLSTQLKGKSDPDSLGVLEAIKKASETSQKKSSESPPKAEEKP